MFSKKVKTKPEGIAFRPFVAKNGRSLFIELTLRLTCGPTHTTAIFFTQKKTLVDHKAYQRFKKPASTPALPTHISACRDAE